MCSIYILNPLSIYTIDTLLSKLNLFGAFDIRYNSSNLYGINIRCTKINAFDIWDSKKTGEILGA